MFIPTSDDEGGQQKDGAISSCQYLCYYHVI